MEEEKDNTIQASPDALPPVQKRPPAKARVSKIKPLLEGINTPYASADVPKVELTNSEKKLIHDIDVPETLVPVKQEKPKSVVKPMQSFPTVRPNAKPLAPLIVQKRSKVWIVIVILLGILAGAGIFAWQTDYRLPFFDKNSDVQNMMPTPNTDTPSNPGTVVDNPLPEPEPTSTPVTVPSPDELRLQIRETPTGYLNVRAQPSISAEQIGRIAPGETYVYTEVRFGWYHIQLTDGSSGWVSGQYVQKMP